MGLVVYRSGALLVRSYVMLVIVMQWFTVDIVVALCWPVLLLVHIIFLCSCPVVWIRAICDCVVWLLFHMLCTVCYT